MGACVGSWAAVQSLARVAEQIAVLRRGGHSSRAPPSSPYGMTLAAGLKDRYELDVEASTLPISCPKGAYVPPVLVLRQDERALLQAGQVCSVIPVKDTEG